MTSCAGCGKGKATLVCPTCKELGLKYLFCQQSCFQANWKVHKQCHHAKRISSIGLTAVRLEMNEELGRVLVASKSFVAGDIVLEESPFSVFQGSVGLMTQFSSMNEIQKGLLMDFQHVHSLDDCLHPNFRQLIDEQLQDQLRSDEFLALMTRCQVDRDSYIRLLSLMLINTHMFDDGNGFPAGALFYTASKMAHDCNPNCSYSSKILQNHLVYFANRDIAEGEILSFSYIEKDYLPAYQRKQILQKSKNFTCRCSTCSSADYARGLRCCGLGCPGYTYPTPSSAEISSNDSNDSWSCDSCLCKDTPTELLSRVETMYAKFLKFKLDTTEVTPEITGHVGDMLNELESLVAFTNYRLIEIEEYFAQVLDFVIRSWEEVQNHRKATESRELAVSVLLRLTKRIECLNQKCAQGSSCNATHPPLASCASNILWAALHAIKERKGTATRQRLPARVVSYLPILTMCFGSEDIDVRSIRSASMA